MTVKKLKNGINTNRAVHPGGPTFLLFTPTPPFSNSFSVSKVLALKLTRQTPSSFFKFWRSQKASQIKEQGLFKQLTCNFVYGSRKKFFCTFRRYFIFFRCFKLVALSVAPHNVWHKKVLFFFVKSISLATETWRPSFAQQNFFSSLHTDQSNEKNKIMYPSTDQISHDIEASVLKKKYQLLFSQNNLIKLLKNLEEYTITCISD